MILPTVLRFCLVQYFVSALNGLGHNIDIPISLHFFLYTSLTIRGVR